MIRVCLVLQETTKPSFKVVVQLSFPTVMSESSYCSTSPPEFGIVSDLDFDHSSSCVVLSYCCFNLYFIGEVSVQVFGPFLKQDVCFLIVEF